MTAVKICGITRVEDAQRAAGLGADFIGVVLWPNSPRAATLDTVRAIGRRRLASALVGVFVNPSANEVIEAGECGIQLAQIHGAMPVWADDGTPGMPIIRAVSIEEYRDGTVGPEDLVLLDAHDPVRHGGTGRAIDWARAAEIARRCQLFLAGGLTPDNVGAAIAQVRPFAVDVASGVEAAPGIKDHDKLRAFVAAAKGINVSTR